MLSLFFRKHCPIRGVFSKKINVKNCFTLIGRSAGWSCDGCHMACHPGLNTGVSFTVLLTPSPARDNLITFYNQNRDEVGELWFWEGGKKFKYVGDFSLVRVSLCCSRLYFVLKCFLMKVLCHLSVSPLIGIYNNVKIENILNSNFLLASAEDQTARQSSEINIIYQWMTI